jgi:Fe2+ or Zn2+ uptake regulation protein
VWEAIVEGPAHQTADEIALAVRSVDANVNLSSIYRSLALFSDLGLVRESNLGSGEATHWELAHPDEQFHLRCTSCGSVTHHTGDLVAQVEAHLTRNHGFRAERVELLVQGLCEDCTKSS